MGGLKLAQSRLSGPILAVVFSVNILFSLALLDLSAFPSPGPIPTAPLQVAFLQIY